MKILPADFAALDATSQAELVCTRRASARELVQAAIDRIEQLDGSLNAVVHTRFERALEECDAVDPARQPFAGVPILLKDAGVPQRGEPHHQGMAVLRAYDHREREDGWLVERLRAAGFVVVTNVSMDAQTLTLLAPCSGGLPSCHLLMGKLEWMESSYT